MHARVATFHNDPGNIDGAIAKIREHHGSCEAMRAGDVAMNAGPGQAGSRSAVEFYEVAIHTLD